MNIWLVISAIAIAFYTFIRFGITEDDARRAEVFGYTGKSLKQRLGDLAASRGSAQMQKKLESLGMSYAAYFRRTIVYGVLGGIVFGVASKNLAGLAIGAFVGYFVQYLSIYQKYKNWRDELLGEISNLVALLKIRLLIGDTVPTAIAAVLPVLHGAMAVEWTRLVTQTAGRTPLPEALDRLINRVADRDMSAVLLRLKTYYREGVPVNEKGEPADPFGNMSETLTRSAAKRTKYFTKKLTGPLTGLAAVGVMCFFIWLIPYFWTMVSAGMKRF